MNLFIEWLLTNVLMFYYFLEGVVLFFVPRRLRFKDVKGQIVLVTGAGRQNVLTSGAGRQVFRISEGR